MVTPGRLFHWFFFLVFFSSCLWLPNSAMDVSSIWSMYWKVFWFVFQPSRSSEGISCQCNWDSLCMESLQVLFITIFLYVLLRPILLFHMSLIQKGFLNSDIVGNYWTDSPLSMLPIYRELISAGLRIWVYRYLHFL